MGQVARSMNPPQGIMCDDSVRSSDTSTTSSSGENSSTHSPDSTSNTIMLMDKYTHITSSDNFMDSLPRYDSDKRLPMGSTRKDDDDVCLQTVPGSDRDSGNMSIELWNEYRPALLHYPGLQSKIISPLPGIFHSLQLRNTDAQPSTTTTATTDKMMALRSQYDIPFDSDKNDDTVRAFQVAIDELASMMNTHSLLSDHTNNYAEEQLVKHSDKGNMTPTTSGSTSMDTGIRTSSAKPTSTSSDSTSQPFTTSNLPAEFRFSFARNPSQEPKPTSDNVPTKSAEEKEEPHPPTIVQQRKILPLPKPRVKRTIVQPSTTPISSEFTFKSPYSPSAHSKTTKKEMNNNNNKNNDKVSSTTKSHQSNGMNQQQTKDNDETPQDYTKKAKRSGDCYTDDDDEDSGGSIFRTSNRYSKTTMRALTSSGLDRHHPLDPQQQQHSFLPPSLLQHSFLQPLPKGFNGLSPSPSSSSSKPPPSLKSKSKPIPSTTTSSSSSSSSSTTANNKKISNKNRSIPPISSSHTDTNRKNNINNSHRTDTNRNTRGKQHGKQQQHHILSPSSSSTSTPTSRRKGKQGGLFTDDTTYPYYLGGIGGGGGKYDSSLDLVTSPWVGPDDWVCLFCQYQIFKKGWFNAKRKLLVQEQRKRIIQNRLEHRPTRQQQQQQKQQFKDSRCDGGKTGRFGPTQLDTNPVT